MSTDLDILLQLRRYAKGELSEAERQAVEALLQEQPELRQELTLTQSLIRATEDLELQRLLKVVEAVPSRPEKPSPLTVVWDWVATMLYPRPALPTLATVTTLLLVLVAAIWWMRTPAVEPYPEFIANAYIEPVNTRNVRGATTLEHPVDLAYRAFDMGKYDETLLALKNVPEADSLYLDVLFLRGHAYYRSNRYDLAAQSFNRFLELYPQSSYKKKPNPDNANWTRILALDKLYRQDPSDRRKQALLEAIRNFMETADQTDSYYKKAGTLLNILEG
ncbi:MAG: hypothetical protein EP344_02820 [Bacteroidetes bacterium]|nr:MAG: hypothetical protein EP344_02820 [Bacteroidota bacterium]